MINKDKKRLRSRILLMILAVSSAIAFSEKQAFAQANFKSFKVVVNSDRDEEIIPDEKLTLREAISVVNKTLPLAELSPEEQKQVSAIAKYDASRIEFDLPAPVKIELQDLLPPLIAPGLTVDGTTHADYDANNSATAEIPIPIPVVSLTPAPDKDIFRGLTISGDRITVRGLSIYGFDRPHNPTDTTPGADIVVSALLPAIAELELQTYPPQNVTIVDNWLGLPPDESLNEIPSNFGIWLFDGVKTKISRNRIYHHGGSGILTSVDATKTEIEENIIVGNGLRGMPHAIYLEGKLEETRIVGNLLCGNDGSGIYLFKPEGKINILNNTIKFNGRRVPSAAIYLIGNGHQVIKNDISWQTGTGVSIAAYPQSDRNLIENNAFQDLEGLSIDLNTRNRTSKSFFKLGDGVNPIRNSGNRSRDKANRAINAPQFLSEEFYLIDGKVNIDGVADPGSRVTLYRVEPDTPRDIKKRSPLATQSQGYGPLSQPLTTEIANKQGRFSFTLHILEPGTKISAIATKSNYGTSEPAFNAVVRSLDNAATKNESAGSFPRCTTKPVAKVYEPPAKMEVEVIPPPQPSPPKRQAVKLNVPRNIHFALDKSYISAGSARILDRIAEVLAKYPFLTIDLQGHTDPRGNIQYNLALSKRRADSTRNYLLTKGVPPERMTIRSLGESQLKKTGTSIVEHAYNRRVEVIFRALRGLDIIFEEQDSDLQLERSHPYPKVYPLGRQSLQRGRRLLGQNTLTQNAPWEPAQRAVSHPN